MPESIFIAREEYSVVNKVTTGGRTLRKTITTRYHSFEIPRVSPIWRFIAIARKNDKDAVFVLIEEKDIEIFESAMTGDKFDHAKLASFRCFMEPVESPVPPELDGP
jgi:hypothetical protein